MSIAGVRIRVQPAFLLIAGLIGFAPGRTTTTVVAWIVIVTASILVHEAGHAIAFRRFGHDADITLTGYGGLTAGRPRPGRQPLSHLQHIAVSVAGPFAGLAIGLVALAVQRTGAGGTGWLDVVVLINVGWGLLNLLPILPLDGGQVMGSVLSMRWPRQGRRIAATASAGIGAVLAVVAIASGYLLAGIMAGILVGMNLGEARADGTGSDDPSTRIAQAGRQMQSRDWNGAIATLRATLASGPPPAARAAATQLLGWALLGAGRHDAVAELVNRERFNHLPVATLRAVAASAQGDPTAPEALARALGTEPVDPPGWAVALLGDDTGAIERLGELCAAEPPPSGAIAVLALASWLERGARLSAALGSRPRAAAGPAASSELAAVAARSARALGLEDDARRWEELAVSLPPASRRA